MLLLPSPCCFLRLRLASQSHSWFYSQWLREEDGRSCIQQGWGAQSDLWEAQTNSLTFIWQRGKESWIWGSGGKWLSKDICVPTRRPVRSGRVRKVCRGQRSTGPCTWGSVGWKKVIVIAVWLREFTDLKPFKKLCSAQLLLLPTTDLQYGDI